MEACKCCQMLNYSEKDLIYLRWKWQFYSDLLSRSAYTFSKSDDRCVLTLERNTLSSLTTLANWTRWP